ncbi:uncharacterized protein [Periplaneta americana]|uniref:uncharacterized protein n=1 Tax=Periplaneta americana TaxID=6978 RepID=UPI0037E73312
MNSVAYCVVVLLLTVVCGSRSWQWDSDPLCPEADEPLCWAAGLYLPHPSDCHYFVQCDAGKRPICRPCAPGTNWNPEAVACDHIWNFECKYVTSTTSSTNSSMPTTPETSTEESVPTTPFVPTQESVPTTQPVSTQESVPTTPPALTQESVPTTEPVSTQESVPTIPPVSTQESVPTSSSVSTH